MKAAEEKHDSDKGRSVVSSVNRRIAGGFDIFMMSKLKIQIPTPIFQDITNSPLFHV